MKLLPAADELIGPPAPLKPTCLYFISLCSICAKPFLFDLQTNYALYIKMKLFCIFRILFRIIKQNVRIRIKVWAGVVDSCSHSRIETEADI